MFYSRRGEKRRRGTVQLGPLHGVASGRRRLSPGARAHPPPGSAEAGGDRGDRIPGSHFRMRRGRSEGHENQKPTIGGGISAKDAASERKKWADWLGWNTKVFSHVGGGRWPPTAARGGGMEAGGWATVRKRKGAHAHRKNKEGRRGPRSFCRPKNTANKTTNHHRNNKTGVQLSCEHICTLKFFKNSVVKPTKNRLYNIAARNHPNVGLKHQEIRKTRDECNKKNTTPRAPESVGPRFEPRHPSWRPRSLSHTRSWMTFPDDGSKNKMAAECGKKQPLGCTAANS